MSREASNTTEEELGESSIEALPRPPIRFGCLTLLFENGRPTPHQTFDLSRIAVVVFGRATLKVTSSAVSGEDKMSLAIEVDDSRMSLHHAHMHLLVDGWIVQDGQSRNGTRVNGQTVKQLKLRSGDLIEMGRTFFVFSDGPVYVHRTDGEMPSGMSTANPHLGVQFERLAAIARSPAPISILVRGETGTGKELVASAVHTLSGRTGPFRAVNCGALPRSLLEAELFGFRKGAFSGAGEDRPGLIRSADKGTLFLDEIGDLPLDAQSALLRVLQEREVLPVGAVKPIPIDVRVVAATHRDLAALAAQERFRADLLSRLAGFSVFLLPLRQRPEDLGALTRTLAQRYMADTKAVPEFTPGAIRLLYGYAWPGNIRELEKAVASGIVLAAGKPIDVEHLPETTKLAGQKRAPANQGPETDNQRGELETLLTRHNGNVAAVAADMRTSRMQIHRLCKRLGVDLRAYRLPH